MRLLVVEDTHSLAEYVSVACHAKGFVVDLAFMLRERPP
jgi:DNA-binding response OmpR family regulator